MVFENRSRTFLAEDEKPLGRVVYGNRTTKKMGAEGSLQNVFGSYFHGPSCPEMPIWPIA